MGRCIAENETSFASNSITLTYGADGEGNSDHYRANVLVYSDVQKYLKRLRFHGYPCRYFAVGEYGSKKERAHWHLLIFWTERVPCFDAGELLVTPHNSGEKQALGDPYPHRENFTERHWPHGWSFWADFSTHDIKYVCKYILKEYRDAEAQGQLAMSKRPPLGAKYFELRAGDFVKQGLAPQDPYYGFGNVRRGRAGKGRRYDFLLQRQSLDLFLQSYLDQWAEKRGGHPPVSPFLEEWCDRKAAGIPDMGWTPSAFRPEVRVASPWIEPPGGAAVQFSEGHNSFYCEVAGKRLFWSFDDEGERAWRSVILSESAAEKLRERRELRKVPAEYQKARDGGRF